MPIELESRARTISHGSRKRTRLQISPQQRTNHDARINAMYYKYGLKNVIKLIIPISLCMLIVVISINNVTFSMKGQQALQTPYHENSEKVIDKLWDAVINSLITIFITIISTTILVFLYVYNFYKVLVAWFLFSAVMILFALTYIFFVEVLKAFNVPVDIFSALIFYWNFGIIGMLCIFWKAPQRLQQGYLIFISARTAVMLIRFLPNWTAWVLLIGLSIWDVIAVLTPRGPLKKLVEVSTERDEPIFPMFIYSTLVYGTITAADVNQEAESGENINTSTVDNESGESNQQSAGTTRSPRIKSRKRKRKQIRKKPNPSDEGFKLGLGDFIFYSVLVGKASSFGNWFTTFTCFIAVLIGLCLTLLLLMSFKQALPALPISVAFGIVFYFFFDASVQPLEDLLSVKQVFV